MSERGGRGIIYLQQKQKKMCRKGIWGRGVLAIGSGGFQHLDGRLLDAFSKAA